VPGRHVPTVPRALRPIGLGDDPASSFRRTVELVLEQQDRFDLIHAHLGPWNLELARRARIPVVSTFHRRLDLPWARDAFHDGVRGLVAISQDQARVHPAANWTVIHHGLTFHLPALAEAPGEGVRDSVDIARLSGRRLMAAAKTPSLATEIEYFNAVIKSALGRAGVTRLGGAIRG
jgi:hypothetical protein